MPGFGGRGGGVSSRPRRRAAGATSRRARRGSDDEEEEVDPEDDEELEGEGSEVGVGWSGRGRERGLERGREQGWEQGREQGREQGWEQGRAGARWGGSEGGDGRAVNWVERERAGAALGLGGALQVNPGSDTATTGGKALASAPALGAHVAHRRMVATRRHRPASEPRQGGTATAPDCLRCCLLPSWPCAWSPAVQEGGGGGAGEQYTIACPCGVTHDDGEMMIECESCAAWAHVSCLKRQMETEPERYT